MIYSMYTAFLISKNLLHSPCDMALRGRKSKRRLLKHRVYFMNRNDTQERNKNNMMISKKYYGCAGNLEVSRTTISVRQSE